jgi:hypothetical protein
MYGPPRKEIAFQLDVLGVEVINGTSIGFFNVNAAKHVSYLGIMLQLHMTSS